jgi:hypothetical protein
MPRLASPVAVSTRWRNDRLAGPASIPAGCRRGLVKDLLESLAASIVVYSDARRRPAGARLAPGSGRRPRTRGLRRQPRAGNVSWTTRAEQDRNRRRRLLSNEVSGDGLASRPGRALDGRRGTGIATTVVGAGRAGGHPPSGRLAPPPGERPRRGAPYSYLIRGRYAFCTHLEWAALQLPGVEWRRIQVTDEPRPRPNPPPDQQPDPNEEFRRALERETDVSLREDPERRRMYTSMDLPRSRSPSDDRSPPPRRHHRHDELTWNGETLTLVGWSQRTGIRVEVLLRRCRRGWSVQQVLTTPLGEDRPGLHSP